MSAAPVNPGPGEDLPFATAFGTGNLDLVRVADALLAGDLAAAEMLCREFLKREPRNVAAIRMLGEVAMKLGRLDDAENLLTYCLELAPDFHLARHSYAALLARKLELREALTEIEKVLAAEPERAAHLLLKASILAQLADGEEAIEILDALSARYPGQARVILGKAHALKTSGRQAEAVAAFRGAAGLATGAGEAYWGLAELKTFRFENADVARMQELLADPAVSADDALYLSFALGKAYEDRGDYDQSFRHYANGNAARRRGVHWDADRHHTELETLAEFFQPGFFAEREGWGNDSRSPIFIVGLPRAGSTLLEQVLASHSEVEGTLELPDIMTMVRRLGQRQEGLRYPEVLAGLEADEFDALGAAYLERTAVHRKGKPRFIDKMPNNFAHVGLIHLVLPNAKILDARRHPMACGFSVFKQLFANGQCFSYNLEEIGRYYADYVALMAHWNRVLPGRVLRVEYEQMVASTDETVRRVLDFCELEFEPACLAFHRTERAVRTASSEQVRQPIYSTAVEQWRNYERHLGPLRQALEAAHCP